MICCRSPIALHKLCIANWLLIQGAQNISPRLITRCHSSTIGDLHTVTKGAHSNMLLSTRLIRIEHSLGYRTIRSCTFKKRQNPKVWDPFFWKLYNIKGMMVLHGMIVIYSLSMMTEHLHWQLSRENKLHIDGQSQARTYILWVKEPTVPFTHMNTHITYSQCHISLPFIAKHSH